jgi:hypothetical protein
VRVVQQVGAGAGGGVQELEGKWHAY